MKNFEVITNLLVCIKYLGCVCLVGEETRRRRRKVGGILGEKRNFICLNLREKNRVIKIAESKKSCEL